MIAFHPLVPELMQAETTPAEPTPQRAPFVVVHGGERDRFKERVDAVAHARAVSGKTRGPVRLRVRNPDSELEYSGGQLVQARVEMSSGKRR